MTQKDPAQIFIEGVAFWKTQLRHPTMVESMVDYYRNLTSNMTPEQVQYLERFITWVGEERAKDEAYSNSEDQ